MTAQKLHYALLRLLSPLCTDNQTVCAGIQAHFFATLQLYIIMYCPKLFNASHLGLQNLNRRVQTLVTVCVV